MIRCPGCGEENPPKFRLCGYCGTPLAAAAPPPAPVDAQVPTPGAAGVPAATPASLVRKTVTFLFCDLKGSTALGERLDPEAFHEVKERYFAAMSAQILQHGGTIEKYVGDAIMAVFGIPVAREDDALRAARAALGMQAALDGLNEVLRQRYGVQLINRTGVNTGEVVATTDTSADQRLATSDTVNVASRLEQAAPDNQIYIGHSTWELVRDAVTVESVEPLELKGKRERVAAHRLLAVQGSEGVLRRHEGCIVGRDPELAQIRALYEEACSRRVARLITILGDAGTGKTRLALAVAAEVADRARVISGRCLSYGEGITFWPLMMMIQQAAGVDQGDGPAAVRAKLACVGEPDVVDRLASVLGLHPMAFPVHEVQWAARKFFEGLARTQPLMVFVDDVQWAEPALLKLLEYCVETVAGHPMLFICTARLEMLARLPDWSTAPGMARIELKPLAPAFAAQSLRNLVPGTTLPDALVQRIVHVSEGNPLYAEQMLWMLIDSGALERDGSNWVLAHDDQQLLMPPTIRALLEARVDALGRPERLSAEPAAVIGVEFEQRAVSTLAPDAIRPTLPQHLQALVQKHLIWFGPATEIDRLYHFRHQLLRETVYGSMTKRARAAMHLGFVQWADHQYPDRATELEEVLAYHLEQAHRFLGDLGPLDEEGRAAGLDAAQRLSNAGLRAARRGDSHATVNLLRRAAALLPERDAKRLALLPELGDALKLVGDFPGAQQVLQEAVTLARKEGNPRVEAAARVHRMLNERFGADQETPWTERTVQEGEALLKLLEGVDGADAELSAVWRMIATAHGMTSEWDESGAAFERALHHGRKSRDERLVARAVAGVVMNDLMGSTRVEAGIANANRALASGIADKQVEAVVRTHLAMLLAFGGDIAGAREMVRAARQALIERGARLFAVRAGIWLAHIELRGRDLAFAEQVLLEDCAVLESTGDRYFLPTCAALLAQVRLEAGVMEGVQAWVERARDTASEDDADAQIAWRLAEAHRLSRQGQAAGAQALCLEALTIWLPRAEESPLLALEAWSWARRVAELSNLPELEVRAAGELEDLRQSKGVAPGAHWG